MSSIHRTPLVVLLAGLPGSGKSTFAPYLAKAMSAHVLDTDDLFDAPRVAVGNALGIGTKVVDEPQWIHAVHDRLLSLLLSLASTAATVDHPVIAVSPWTGFRKQPVMFEKARAELLSEFYWVIATCPPQIRFERICERGRPMDSLKIASGLMPDPELNIPEGAITVDLGCSFDTYGVLASNVALQLAKLSSYK